MNFPKRKQKFTLDLEFSSFLLYIFMYKKDREKEKKQLKCGEEDGCELWLILIGTHSVFDDVSNVGLSK